jgi:hypothetical protein
VSTRFVAAQNDLCGVARRVGGERVALELAILIARGQLLDAHRVAASDGGERKGEDADPECGCLHSRATHLTRENARDCKSRGLLSRITCGRGLR